MLKLKQKLQNPFVLMAQGFVAGAIIFFATNPVEADPQRAGAPVQSVEAASAEISKA